MNIYTLLLLFCFVVFAFAHDLHYKNQLVLEVSNNPKENILQQHNQYDGTKAHIKKFTGGDTLAYVTPWNNKGYDTVKTFKGKFDYISPVWYNIQRISGKLVITGEHDVDRSWMDQVRGKSNSVGDMIGQIVPLIQFHGWQLNDYQHFMNDGQDQRQLNEVIIEQVRKHGFDGITLECGYPMPLGVYLKSLADELHRINKKLILVLPPLRKGFQPMVTAEAYGVLATFVDRFSLMTYDYSSYLSEGGPNAPTDWITDNIDELTNGNNRHQLLVGINLYAMSYLGSRQPQPLIMPQVLDKLSTTRDTLDDDEGTPISIEWDEASEEHWFEDWDEDGIMEGVIWMPTIKSLQRRIHLAEDYQVGLSLWEVGQGLDYFYDLL
ncbi:glycoside hydrolase superfamily [Chlamydoabsidia padenii]|nr:glycoside hydrolase superfamily [Chlamydoabsidia padenii]